MTVSTTIKKKLQIEKPSPSEATGSEDRAAVCSPLATSGGETQSFRLYLPPDADEDGDSQGRKSNSVVWELVVSGPPVRGLWMVASRLEDPLGVFSTLPMEDQIPGLLA